MGFVPASYGKPLGELEPVQTQWLDSVSGQHLVNIDEDAVDWWLMQKTLRILSCSPHRSEPRRVLFHMRVNCTEMSFIGSH